MTNRTIVVVSVLVIAAGVLINAQSGTVRYVPPQPRPVRLIESFRPEGRGDTKVIGAIIDMRQAPVGRARVQLRDLSNGAIVQQGVSDEAGEYEFTSVDAGTYVVEMLGSIGQIVGLSNAVPLAQFQTINTLIQLQGHWDVERKALIIPQSKLRFIGMSASATMTAATIQFAANADVPPADPGEPVSP